MDDIGMIKKQLHLKQWAAQVAEYQDSGLTLADWCREQNIHPNTFCYRLKQIRKHAIAQINRDFPVNEISASARDKEPTFKQLKVMPPALTHSQAITVHMAGATVEIPKGISKDAIEAVLHALKETC